MTWNLLHGGLDGDDRRRSALQGEVIREIDPDVLLVQEARGFLEDGGRRLFGVERSWGRRGFVGCSPVTGQHTGVFVRPELAPLAFRVDASHFHHAASLLTLDLPPGPVTFVSVHLCPTYPDARRSEAAQLAGLAAPDTLVVVGGDCNAPSPADPPVDLTPLPPYHRIRYADRSGDADRRAIELLLSAGFAEVRTDATPTVPTVAFPDAEFVPFRADHVFTTGARAGEGTTRVLVDERTAGASDHYPVVAELDLW